MPFGELRVGGFRYTSQTQGNPAFSLIISSDQRLIVGININDVMEKPYIKAWLHEYSSFYTDALGVVDEKRRQDIVRFFFNNALAVKLNAIDCALNIKPKYFSPLLGHGNQNFTEGLLCTDTLLSSFQWHFQFSVSSS